MDGVTVRRGERSPLLLGIDIGTSRLKLAVYDVGLNPIHASAADTSSLAGARKGRLDAVALWQALRDQLADLTQHVDCRQIAALGIAGMAESGCLIDSENKPITPMLLWHDRRGVRQAAALRRRAGKTFARVTGLKTTSVRSLAKWKWMREHGAPLSARWCGAPEWISLCLTGVWRTDATLAVRTGAFDVLKGEFSSQLLRIAGAPQGLFPPAQGASTPPARIRGAIARDFGFSDSTEIVIAGHDDIVAAYGAGGHPGDLIDSGGTAEGLIRIVDAPPDPVETVRLRMAMSRFYRPHRWALIAGAGSTGALMLQAAQMLGSAPADLDAIAAPVGVHGTGLIETRLSKNALPTIEIRSGASPGETWSAVLDLVCDRVEETASRLERLAGAPSRLLLIGGAASSAELGRRKSSRLGLPLAALAGMDATTLGAAGLAARAIGLNPDNDFRS